MCYDFHIYFSNPFIKNSQSFLFSMGLLNLYVIPQKCNPKDTAYHLQLKMVKYSRHRLPAKCNCRASHGMNKRKLDQTTY